MSPHSANKPVDIWECMNATKPLSEAKKKRTWPRCHWSVIVRYPKRKTEIWIQNSDNLCLPLCYVGFILSAGLFNPFPGKFTPVSAMVLVIVGAWLFSNVPLRLLEALYPPWEGPCCWYGNGIVAWAAGPKAAESGVAGIICGATIDWNENVCVLRGLDTVDVNSLWRNEESSLIKMKRSLIGLNTVPMAESVRFGNVYSWVRDFMSSAILITSWIHVSIWMNNVPELGEILV